MSQIFLKFYKYKRFLVAIGVFLVIAMFTSTSTINALQSYQDGAYGDCAYSDGCDPVNPPTVVPVPPTTQNPESGRVISVNIEDGQKIEQDSKYPVVITPNFAPETIKKVEFYQNGKLIGTSTKSKGSRFIIDWITPPQGKYDLLVKVHLKDGSTILQKFKVTMSGLQETTEDKTQPSSHNSSENTNTDTGILNTDQNYGIIRRLVEATPKSVAYTMPYIAIGLLTMLLLTMLYQLRNQLAHMKILVGLLDRDKQLASEKANFVMLASHYLRTPLTIIGGTVEIALMTNKNDDQLLALQSNVRDLHTKAEGLLADIQSNKDLRSIDAPDEGYITRRIYLSPGFIVPVVVSIVLTVALNWIFISANKTELILPNIVTQILLLGIVVAYLFVIFTKHSHNRQEQAKIENQTKYEESLDIARNKFIKSAADELSPLIVAIRKACGDIQELAGKDAVSSATSELESLLSKFILVTQLEKGKIETGISEIASKQMIDSILVEFAEIIKSKHLDTDINVQTSKFNQSEALLKYVLRILFDNATKFSTDDTKLRIKSSETGRVAKKSVQISVQNSTKSIDPDKISNLFKPFTRGHSVETFNEEGVGISLYLARLIMRYLNGDISLKASPSGKSVTASLNIGVSKNP